MLAVQNAEAKKAAENAAQAAQAEALKQTATFRPIRPLGIGSDNPRWVQIDRLLFDMFFFEDLGIGGTSSGPAPSWKRLRLAP